MNAANIRNIPLIPTLDAEPLDTRPLDGAEALRGLAGGGVYLPGDAAYDAKRLAWNLTADQRPAAVAYPHHAAEVCALVRMAADAGLKVAPQSTGHNAPPLVERGLDDVVLVRMSDMDDVTIDPARRIARAEGGALWLPAVEGAAEHGLVALHGSSPDVGIAGYSLGGGIGWYARKLGLATNSLTAVELVIGDGSFVRADATNNAALFWALRGGGGNFGVVTALEFALYPIETAYAGMFVWDIAHAERILRYYADWYGGTPDAISTSFRILRLPPVPDIPEFLRGRAVVVVNGAVLGSDEFGGELLAGFRALQPEIDTWSRVPAGGLARLHMDPEGGTPVVTDAGLLGSFGPEAVDAFLEVAGPDAHSSLLVAELRQLGGAVARKPHGAGVVSKFDADFFALGVAVTPTAEAYAAGKADATAFVEALAPWRTAKTYLNLAESEVDARTGFDDDVWTQLAGIRSAVDPDDVFVANHRIPRLYENGAKTT